MKNKFDFSDLFRHTQINRIGELNPYITLACDLRCDYCYMYPFLEKARNVAEIMSREFLNGLVDYFIDSGGSLDRLTFLGGEPTLHPEITQMINDVAVHQIAELRMTTNATSLHYLQLDRLTTGAFDHVSVSIDGITPSVNDKTRGNGTFHRIIDTMTRYADAGIPLSVNYTVTDANLDTMIDAAAFFQNMGVVILNFHRASMSGNAYNNQNLIVDGPRWVAARDKLLRHLDENKSSYRGMTFRVPYIFLDAAQAAEFDYQPIQKKNYHSPRGGHRLIVLPPTLRGKGLCYMSSDLIGEPNSELGAVDDHGNFKWNNSPDNELIAFSKNPDAPNVSTTLAGQDLFELRGNRDLMRVSHSFKETIIC